MNSKINEKELIDSIKILFPQLGQSDATSPGKVTLGTVKSAFKALALRNHPDRSKIIGTDEKILNEKFMRINEAYKKLCIHIESGAMDIVNNYTKKDLRPEKTYPFENKCAPDQKKRYYEQFAGSIYLPEKEILLGQFLMYAGLISLNSLVEAVFWQRKQRPSFGMIATDWKILTPFKIADILKNKKINEKFGDCAIRLKYITPFQQRAILCKQMRFHKKIGEYFVRKGTISAEKVNELHDLQKIHNSRISRR